MSSESPKNLGATYASNGSPASSASEAQTASTTRFPPNTIENYQSLTSFGSINSTKTIKQRWPSSLGLPRPSALGDSQRYNPKLVLIACLSSILASFVIATSLLVQGEIRGSLIMVTIGIFSLVLTMWLFIINLQITTVAQYSRKNTTTSQIGVLMSIAWVGGSLLTILLQPGLITQPVALCCLVGPIILLLFISAHLATQLAVFLVSTLMTLVIVHYINSHEPFLSATNINSFANICLISLLLIIILATVREQTQQISQLTLQLDRKNSLLYGIPDYIIRLDHHGLIIDAFSPTAGVGHPKAWIGQNINDVAPAIMETKSISNKIHPQHTQLNVDGMIRDIEVRPVKQLHGEKTLLLRDITDSLMDKSRVQDSTIKRLEQKLETQLLQASRLAHLGTLTAGIAHEVSNPISYVHNNLTYLRERMAAGSLNNCHDAIEESIEGIEQIKSIAEDIQFFSRSGTSDNMMLVSLEDITKKALRQVRFEAHRRTKVQESHQLSPLVYASPLRLTQVVINLLINAFQAIPLERKNDGLVKICTGKTARGEAFLEVVDNGIGVPDSMRKQIFEPFFSTKPIGQGTGLGLSICRTLIQRQNGIIEIESAVGKGSTFRIRLPDGRLSVSSPKATSGLTTSSPST